MGRFDKVNLGNEKTLSRMVKRHREIANESQICFRKTGDNVRMGRKDWPGDAFIGVSNEDFAIFAKIMTHLSIPMHDWEEDDNDD